MFLISEKKRKKKKYLLKKFYFLWDLGLKVVIQQEQKETISDVKYDIHFETAFLENRYISGNFKTYGILLGKFNIYKSKKISFLLIRN